MVAQVDRGYVKARPSKLWTRMVSYLLFEGRPLTTRGRWINPVLFGMYRLVCALPQARKVNAPIFIIGTGRSGTTALGVVLSMHREIGFLNEPKALWHKFHGKEDLVGSYASTVGSYRLPVAHVDDVMVRRAARLYGAYLTASGSHRVLDKYPEVVFRVPFVKALFPDARFLFLARNGQDTCRSIGKWSSRFQQVRGSEVHDWWGKNDQKWRALVDQLVPEHDDLCDHFETIAALDNDVDRAVVEWIVSMREGMAVSRDYPDSVLQVKYEELCEDPVAILKHVLQFLELSEDSTFLRYAQSVLKRSGDSSPISIHPVLDDPFNQTMRRLGYT
jgi:hypothetical protein